MSTHRGYFKTPLPLIAITLCVLVSCVYWQVLEHPFIDLDDDVYVSENPVVLQGLTPEGIRWAFSTFQAGNWHPLTWLSHMIDVELFGPSPGWHHMTNVLLHLANTVLLFLVLCRMTGGIWQSAFVAALFGVHPLHVESVAWIAERKDVLSTLFWFLTLGAYMRYARRPGIGRYLLVSVLFVLGLMCKPMLVTLPFVLLLLDWWPLGRMVPAGSPVSRSWKLYVPVFFHLLREKLPLLGISVISSVITYLAQAKSGAVSELGDIPFGVRICNAVVSYVVYLEKAVWPVSLAVYYPHPVTNQGSISTWEIAGAIFLLCGLSVIALRARHRRPYLVVGWLWYLGTLIPVIGAIQVGDQALADRYTYVPLVGVFLAVAFGVPEALTGWRLRRFGLGAFAGVSLIAFSVSAWFQTGYWKDSVTLFSRAISVTGLNWLAANNLGASYLQRGQYEEAISYFQEALRIKPYNAETWNNLGVAYHGLGKYQQAIIYFKKALVGKPDSSLVFSNMGSSYNSLGQYDMAIEHLREALRIRPDNAKAWNNLGISYQNLGLYQQAMEYFQQALRLKPDYHEARSNLNEAKRFLND